MFEDNVLFHDPGLICILLVDFEILQLDLCFYFFSWPKTFYVKHCLRDHTIYPAFLGSSEFRILQEARVEFFFELGAVMAQYKDDSSKWGVLYRKLVVSKCLVHSMSCLHKDLSVRCCE